MVGGNIPSIPLTAPITGGYNTNDGWGNNGAWWIIIILFAIFGWGRGGYGYGNGDGCNCNNNAILPISSVVLTIRPWLTS